MSIQALSEYTFQSRYSQYNHEHNRKESWEEAVERIFDMHRKKYVDIFEDDDEIEDLVDECQKAQQQKRVLSSQRLLQVGGQMTLDRNERLYNCTGIAIDKPKAFQDVMWLLLAGCGVGFSVQKFDVERLPSIDNRGKFTKTYEVEDSCEGWSDAIGVLMSSYFSGGGFFPEYEDYTVEFDYSKIRPKGSLVAGQFKAPGPEPLKKAVSKITAILESANGRQLRPIEVYDILMHIADGVVSAGLRRSATIALFSADDLEMAKAKTGDWFTQNPQRGRSNNSAVIHRKEAPKEVFYELFECTKEFGEPGWVFVDNYTQLTNPCAEICWDIPRTDSEYCTIGVCNLVEINGKYCSSKESFLEACRIAATIGTLQAGYTDFPYIGEDAENFIREESLLGVSITGWMEQPEILFDPEILKEGAKLVKSTNAKVAKIIGINKAKDFVRASLLAIQAVF